MCAVRPGAGDIGCSIVFTSYRITEDATGRVGVLGLKRMPYRNVIGTFNAVVHRLDVQFGKTAK